MGGDCSKKRGIPEKHKQGLLDLLCQRGFTTRPRTRAERVGALEWFEVLSAKVLMIDLDWVHMRVAID